MYGVLVSPITLGLEEVVWTLIVVIRSTNLCFGIYCTELYYTTLRSGLEIEKNQQIQIANSEIIFLDD